MHRRGLLWVADVSFWTCLVSLVSGLIFIYRSGCETCYPFLTITCKHTTWCSAWQLWRRGMCLQMCVLRGVPVVLQSDGCCLAFPWRWLEVVSLTIVRYFKFGKKILYLGRTCLLNEAYSDLPLRGNLWLNVRVHDLWPSFLIDGLTGIEAIRIS